MDANDESERIEMSRRERDRLKVLHGVSQGERSQKEAARLLRLLPEFNRRFTVAAARRRNAHRDLGPEHGLPAILSVQHRRTVDNDYTLRFRNRCFQLHPPARPGLRRGQVVLEQRLSVKLWIRFGDHYLSYHEIPLGQTASTAWCAS